MGMLMEMGASLLCFIVTASHQILTGPCTLTSPNATKYNPYSWTNQANMIFLDQPAGVGFSYADHGEQIVRSTFASSLVHC